jgi:hypothetical protein
MPATKSSQTPPAAAGGSRRPSDAQLAAIVEAAYILDAVRP